MADMFDYLKWRGDIPFSKMPPNPVDSVILSTLSYVPFEGIVSDDIYMCKTLRQAATEFLDKPDQESNIRFKKDIELLSEAAKTCRFGDMGLSYYKSVLIPEEDTQFAAIAFWLDDGTVFMAYRGTDKSIAGWKEDFNMSVLETIPAQRMALQYLEDFCGTFDSPIRVGGHSKGGNLAVYASAKSGPAIQNQIIEVYNHDGPGFTDNLLGTEEYINLVPKIRTYVPQSSLIGMLLEHEEPYMVIKSSSIGVLQHDTYTWEVMGPDFVMLEELTSDARFLDKTIKRWMNSMSQEERDQFIETVFDFIEMEGVDTTDDLIKPKNLITYFKTLRTDEEVRQVLAKEVANFVKASGLDPASTKNRVKELKYVKEIKEVKDNLKDTLKEKLSKVKISLEKKIESQKEESNSQEDLLSQEEKK